MPGVRVSLPLPASEWTSLHSDFSLQKNQSYALSFLLFPTNRTALAFCGSPKLSLPFSLRTKRKNSNVHARGFPCERVNRRSAACGGRSKAVKRSARVVASRKAKAEHAKHKRAQPFESLYPCQRRNGHRSIPIFLCRKISHTLCHSSFFPQIALRWRFVGALNFLYLFLCVRRGKTRTSTHAVFRVNG